MYSLYLEMTSFLQKTVTQTGKNVEQRNALWERLCLFLPYQSARAKII